MAGLAELDFEGSIRTVKLPRGMQMTVRGLALSDVTRIFRQHANDVEEIFKGFAEDGAALAGKSGDPKFAQNAVATKFGSELLSNFPELVADIIAYASDEPTLSHKARQLPFPVQMEALKAIAELTFVEEDSLKKVMEIVVQMVAKTTDVLSDLNQQRIGSLPSSDKPAS
jgi:hypothetical protein